MTSKTNARIAGFTFLFYIVVGISSMVLFGKAMSGEGITAKLANIAAHATEMRIAIVLTLLTSFSALVLGVTLYGITRDEDHELAMLAMACRVCEGVLGAISLRTTLGLLWLATEGTGTATAGVADANALGAFLLMPGQSALISATFFVVGSTLFSYLMVRGRMVPVSLAWLGVLASGLLVVGVPLQLVGVFGGLMGGLMWLPMLVFEVTLAVWLLVKGVNDDRSFNRSQKRTLDGAVTAS